MKNKVVMIGIIFLTSCGPSIKLAIPETFKQQATMQHISGARGNKMSFANFTTSKIKRGAHVSSPGWGRRFFLENLLWNQIGIQKTEAVTRERTKFRYSLTDGKNRLEVYAAEEEFTKALEYELFNSKSIFNKIGQLQQYAYIFSAIISGDTTQNSQNWELLMTNIYDRKAENDKNLFANIRQEDDGLVTNGTDTIFIKSLTIKQTELNNGKTGQLPFKVLSGYELSTNDGVIAVIDMIDRNIWFYNELDDREKLNIGAIATAIFARTIHDVKW